MVKTVPLPDGRFNILLQGLREYRIQEEFHDKSYRQARVEWLPERNQTLEPTQREAIGRLLASYLQKDEIVQKFLQTPISTTSSSLISSPFSSTSCLSRSKACSTPPRSTSGRPAYGIFLTSSCQRTAGQRVGVVEKIVSTETALTNIGPLIIVKCGTFGM